MVEVHGVGPPGSGGRSGLRRQRSADSDVRNHRSRHQPAAPVATGPVGGDVGRDPLRVPAYASTAQPGTTALIAAASTPIRQPRRRRARGRCRSGCGRRRLLPWKVHGRSGGPRTVEGPVGPGSAPSSTRPTTRAALGVRAASVLHPGGLRPLRAVRADAQTLQEHGPACSAALRSAARRAAHATAPPPRPPARPTPGGGHGQRHGDAGLSRGRSSASPVASALRLSASSSPRFLCTAVSRRSSTFVARPGRLRTAPSRPGSPRRRAPSRSRPGRAHAGPPDPTRPSAAGVIAFPRGLRSFAGCPASVMHDDQRRRRHGRPESASDGADHPVRPSTVNGSDRLPVRPYTWRCPAPQPSVEYPG